MDENQHRAPIVEVGEEDFQLEVLKSKQPVLVAFGAPWSRPCQIFDSVLEEVAATCVGKVKVVKVNADNAPDLSMWYEIQSVPTLLYFVDGSLLVRVVGTASKEAILLKLQLVFPAGDARALKSQRH